MRAGASQRRPTDSLAAIAVWSHPIPCKSRSLPGAYTETLQLCELGGFFFWGLRSCDPDQSPQRRIPHRWCGNFLHVRVPIAAVQVELARSTMEIRPSSAVPCDLPA